MAKNQVVNLVQRPGSKAKTFTYQVKSITNRLTPHIGEVLTADQVRDLMQNASTKVNIVGA